jgi:hypothetical protein
MSQTQQLVLQLTGVFYAVGYIATAVFVRIGFCRHAAAAVETIFHTRVRMVVLGGSFHRSEDSIAPIRRFEERCVDPRPCSGLRCSLSWKVATTLNAAELLTVPTPEGPIGFRGRG